MKATINGRTYDTDEAEVIYSFDWDASGEDLYLTPEGEFFQMKTETWVDGRQLQPGETIEDYGFKTVKYSASNPPPATALVDNGLRYEAELVLLTREQALALCIKFLIPPSLQGPLAAFLPAT